MTTCSICKVEKEQSQFNGKDRRCRICKREKFHYYKSLYRTCRHCKQKKEANKFFSMRICIDCKKHKKCRFCKEMFHVDDLDKWHGHACCKCIKKYNAERYVKNKERFLKRNKRWKEKSYTPGSFYSEKRRRSGKVRRRKIRNEVLQNYGGKCECCGETERAFLTIDHVNGNGGQHRREIKRFDIAYWLWLNKFPTGYRVLCFNCNVAIFRNGICPHQVSKTFGEIG